MRLERLLAIAMLLLEREEVSGKFLAALFHVSTRTIYRDIEALNQAGIPIITKTGINGGISIMPEFKVSKRIFTVNDLATILTGLEFASRTLSSEEVAVALAKVNSLVPNSHQPAISFKTNQIVFDAAPWLGGQLLEWKINLIKSALNNSQLLSFSYVSKAGKQTKRIVEPCQLINKANLWYLQAYCLASSDFRMFKLSRLTNLEVLAENYQQRQAPTAFLDFSKEMVSKQEKITLLVEGAILERVIDFCGIEAIAEASEGQYYAHLDFIADDYGYAILLGFGASCLCLEPEHVRLEIQKRSKAIASLYDEQP